MTKSDDFEMRLSNVRRRIAEACARVGRNPDSVGLVAVTKGFAPGAVNIAHKAGLRFFGESRVQEALWKAEHCGGGIEWHLVGHLQRNKAPAALSLFNVLHSVDSIRLIEHLERLAVAGGGRPDVLLEVNVSGEASKFGFHPEAVPKAIEVLLEGRVLTLRGLMTVPPYHPDPEIARPFFDRLRAYRDAWSGDFGIGLPDLSMGMSHDFEVAIEEGATWIRIGSALFGERPTSAELRACMASDES